VILLAEDDEDVREMLAFTLTSRGYTVETAVNGREVLDLLSRTRPCLVILDLVMPLMTGQQVLAEMKARKLDDIPVCVISALGGPPPPQAVTSLVKPFDVADVVAIAAKYCAHVRAPAGGA
jgi:DNA-binding response OmpR family regulator